MKIFCFLSSSEFIVVGAVMVTELVIFVERCVHASSNLTHLHFHYCQIWHRTFIVNRKNFTFCDNESIICCPIMFITALAITCLQQIRNELEKCRRSRKAYDPIGNTVNEWYIRNPRRIRWTLEKALNSRNEHKTRPYTNEELHKTQC